ncbi:MAG: hypothetical protein KJ955_03865 [Nanoarchaeota archaeon]|nr:hypothetical protein [Nanoarchaeota archaeon]
MEDGIDAWMKMEAVNEMERIKTDAIKERARYEQRMKRRHDLWEAGKIAACGAGCLAAVGAMVAPAIVFGKDPKGIEAICRATDEQGTFIRDLDGKAYLLKCEEHKPVLYEIGAEGRGQ